MYMWYYCVVKKVGCRYSVYILDLTTNYSLQLKYFQKAQTAFLTSTSCDKLLVAVTQCMTELATVSSWKSLYCYTVHTACLLH